MQNAALPAGVYVHLDLQQFKVMPESLTLIACAIFVVALLYSSVGHAGASGYIAVLSLAGLAPAVIKPTALVLNILVASIAAWQFRRAGHFSWPLFWPFAVGAIPMAMVGGATAVPPGVFRALIGAVLLFSAVRMAMARQVEHVPEAPRRAVALPVGAVLGLLAGLTGTGGGIFLSPLLLCMRWALTKEAAAVSAFFILANSVAGLLGNLAATQRFPTLALLLAGAAVLGGAVGSYLGSWRFDHRAIKRLLAIVLLTAGTKLILTR